MSIKRLALLTALALTALAVSAGSASATIVDTTGPYTGPITGELFAGSPAVLTTGLSTITCTLSTFTGTVDNATNRTGVITAVTFGSCIFNNTVTQPCTVFVTNEPLNFRVDKDPPDGTLVITENVAATVTCLEGTVRILKCEVTAAAGGVTADLDSANDIAIFNETVTTSGFLCGSTGTWTATYSVAPTDLRTQ